MIQLIERLFIGDLTDCNNVKKDPDFARVHSCKIPCHQKGVGYEGNLKSDHPNYLVFEQADDLYLNMIDAKMPMIPKFGDPMFKAAFRFIDEKLTFGPKKVLIHCNRGESRAPSVALAYLAKNSIIGNLTYKMASEEFKKTYPTYQPGDGIAHYLENNWNSVMSL